MKNKGLTKGLLRSGITIVMIALSFGVQAQNLGKQYEWLKKMPKEIPTQSGLPYYSMTIKLDDFEKEQLESNAQRFFKNYFSTEYFKHENNSFIGIGKYTISMDSKNPDDKYEVTYILEINIKKERYEMVMRNFTMERFEAAVDLPKRMKAAEEDIPAAKALCTTFQNNNLIIMKSIYDVMDYLPGGVNATASK